MNKYYVYIYLDPRKQGNYTYGDYSFSYEPLYVGKGNGRRDRSIHRHNIILTNKINKIYEEISKKHIIIRVSEDISEDEAYELEGYLISIIGRLNIKEGPLVNITEGGGGKSHPVSEETKKKLSIINKGQNQGKTYEEIHGIEVAKVLKDNHSKLMSENNPFKNKKHSDGQKIKWSKMRKNVIPWNKGLKKETDLRVKKQSESQKNHIVSEITRKKISETLKNRGSEL